MSIPADSWSNKRSAALQKMRAQYGAQRRANRDSEDHDALLGEYFEPFVRRREGDAPVAPTEVTEFLTKYREEKKKQKKPQPAEATGEPPAPAHAGWQGLLEEADSLDFTKNFGKWLSDAPLDLGLSSTPVPELQRMHAEASFRKKALEAILKITNTEIEALESQINEKKSLAHE